MVTHSQTMDREAVSVHTEQELIGCTLYEHLHMVQSSEPKKKMTQYKAGTSLTQVTGSLYTASFPSLVPRPSPLFVIWFMSKMHKEQRRPGNTCHMNDVGWT